MWIKEPSYPLGESMSKKVNFLYKHENVYIMDNHLAAGWAWLQSINVEDSYSLFHVDRHYDLLDFPRTVKSEIIDKKIKLHELSFQEYLELKQPMNGKSAPLFRWDNYIGNLNIVYPNLFDQVYFATYKDGNKLEDFIDYEVEFHELADNLDYWISKGDKWILNLDIDYFYGHINDNRIQVFTDDFIKQLAHSIKNVVNIVDVVTICLSPEACGGWDKAIKTNKIICDILEVDFSIKPDYIA